MYDSTISLIHKPGKDPLEPGSYRPISLLNVDNKILAKILAMRLEIVLPTVGSEDQTGFVKNRQLFFNIRRLFNIIYTQNTYDQSESEILLSLDAEKAFDRVEWDFLFSTLSKYGIGPNYISFVKLLYTKPQASVTTNNIISSPFLLHRSTRQGCPLSPLLFALVIEPLAIQLRSTKDYKGIRRFGVEHKVSLYADDLLLYIADPTKSLPKIMTVLTEFGKISGYKINLTKSILFPISSLEKLDSATLTLFPFTISNTFKYLGITVTREFSGLFKHNFINLYHQTEQNLERLSKLPISLAGRINIIRMSTLPKFLFLFQRIPILITKTCFKKIDQLISQFIWNKKTPRIKKVFPQRSKITGGMGLPCFQFYY
uniref:Reverse transcriptase domain-containing protein n=1 Tax=Oreochromis niloticus TaxID=8128 RepID=A0A669EME8_ORENI